jgi:transposase-like protein
MRIGVSYDRAATSEGVSARTLRRWLRQGEADLAAGRSTAHAQFVQSFRKAESDALGQLESNMWQQAQEDWKCSAWLLAKKLPNQYGDLTAAAREALQQQVVTEFVSFIESHVSPGAFQEVLHALADHGDDELDPTALPVPA